MQECTFVKLNDVSHNLYACPFAQSSVALQRLRFAICGADPKSEEWAEEYETWCSPESEIFSGLEAGSTSFDTIEKDFAMLATKPGAVGTEPRASISK